eukprot:TRINITY_DN1437_c1_g2_i1.p1 TRINITY_DN1437_c1_g2~~TRINITY_DN1437_c1_g2_i1.p1  ORF type:complete len:364 (+),score=84.32 TRINITY_DN1437_c1_g2_i1:126-1217(+)
MTDTTRRLRQSTPEGVPEGLRSGSSGSLTPPSSPGSQVSLDNGSLGSGSSQPYTYVPRDKTVKKRKKRTVKREPINEAGRVRLGRFVLALLCYAPFFWLWGMRMPSISEELGGLQFLPTAILCACFAVSVAKEALKIHRLSALYPVLSFLIGIVGGCYSNDAMRDQQSLRLLAICAHGIFAGQLRGMSKQKESTSPLNPLGGFVFWEGVGEVACMLYRDFVEEITTIALSYGGFMLVPVAAGLGPALVMTSWVKLFGVEKICTRVGTPSLLSRCISATTWAVSAFAPLIIAGTAMCGALYILLPWVWDRMLFVAPWGVLLEFGSALSCGTNSKSLFYSEPLSPDSRDEKRRNAIAARAAMLQQ